MKRKATTVKERIDAAFNHGFDSGYNAGRRRCAPMRLYIAELIQANIRLATMSPCRGDTEFATEFTWEPAANSLSG